MHARFLRLCILYKCGLLCSWTVKPCIFSSRSSLLCKGDVSALPVEGVPSQACEAAIAAVILPHRVCAQALSAVAQPTALLIISHNTTITDAGVDTWSLSTLAGPAPLLLALAVVARSAACVAPLCVCTLAAICGLICTHPTAAPTLLQSCN